jgi:2-polyprenyl-6-methoxyphenol hydroxylase-like FAD-dependent oxidoreductase
MHDVAVVGAGPVGLFLTAALVARGVDVVTFERRSAARRHSRAIGIHPPALAALEGLGLVEEVVSRGVRIDGGDLRIAGRLAATLEFGRLPEAFPFVVTLPQLETEALLQGALAAHPYALHGGCTVVAVRETEAAAELDIVDAAGRQRTEEARFVVGADGPQSIVRSAARIPDRVRRYPYDYLMGDFADSATTDRDRAVLHLHRDGIVESFPLPGGVRRWVTHTVQGRAVADDPGDDDPSPTEAALLAAFVEQRTGIPIDPATATMTSAFGVRRRSVARMSAGRLAVVGDAAHEVSPIGGQGMNLGWLDAAALAHLLPSLLAHPSESAARLAAFERVRLHSARIAARRAEFNMTMGRPSGAAGFALRRGVVAVTSAAVVRRRLARDFTMHGL